MAETKATEARSTHWVVLCSGMTLKAGQSATRGAVLPRESIPDAVFEKARRSDGLRPASPDEAALSTVSLPTPAKKHESYEATVAQLQRENADLKAENLAQYRRIQQLIGEAELRGPVVTTSVAAVTTDTKPKAPVGGATDDGKLPTDFPHRAELVKVYGEGLSIVGVNALSDDDLAAVPGIKTAAAIKKVRAAAKGEESGD